MKKLLLLSLCLLTACTFSLTTIQTGGRAHESFDQDQEPSSSMTPNFNLVSIEDLPSRPFLV